MPHLMHTGSDYLVNIQNPSSRNFTVAFTSKQVNSSENVIVVADDSILEGTEAFRLLVPLSHHRMQQISQDKNLS